MMRARLISMKGRLSRRQFWFWAIAVWAAFYLAWNFFKAPVPAALVLLLNGVTLVLLWSLCVRRLHDRNYSGWWLLLIFVPVAGALWLAWQIAVKGSLPQRNRWGEDPTGRRGDYLVVQ